jgi:hypothetical protein
MEPDYSKYHHIEDYLFAEVGPRFIKCARISPFDFYVILIWKANQQKRRIRARLRQRAGSFTTAVQAIGESLYASSGSKRKLEVLMKEWGFRLPMATAILTVLYPADFAVYDNRICTELKISTNVAEKFFSDEVWTEYQRFLQAIDAAAPSGLSLRDKSRYLWGRALYNEVAANAV